MTKMFKEISIRLVGNKVTLLSITLASIGLGNTIVNLSGPTQKDFQETYQVSEDKVASEYSNFKEESLLFEILKAQCSIIGGCGLGMSLLGSSTRAHYKRTLEHIQKRGKLEEKYLETLIENSENRQFVGYCQLQGAYLAARETEQLKTFYRIKKEYSNNIIPNF